MRHVVRSRRVVVAGRVGPASLHIDGGVIAAVAGYDELPPGWPVRDAGDAVVMPGLVDSHVHVNEPGRTHWEGFASATAAAAAGGVTTLVDMPLNSVPATTTRAAIVAKREAGHGKLRVDVGLWGGVVPGNSAELAGMLHDGVCGFKCFLVDSGVPEFPPVTAADLAPVLPMLAEAGAPLLVHAELAGPIEAARAKFGAADCRRYASFVAMRPPAAEVEAVALMVSLCRTSGARVHIVHHAASEALPLIEAARHDGLPMSAETCPHYLHFTSEAVPDGATQFKCVPPIRDEANRERLWEGLRAGVLDQIVSDHSPCEPALKLLERGDFREAWGGIASLQLGLPVVWTELSRRGFTLEDLARWMCEAPARLAGLGRKGRLGVGADADLVIWDPDAEVAVDANTLAHRHKVTPYAGEVLRGRVMHTMVRGALVYEQGRAVGEPVGRWVSP